MLDFCLSGMLTTLYLGPVMSGDFLMTRQEMNVLDVLCVLIRFVDTVTVHVLGAPVGMFVHG